MSFLVFIWLFIAIFYYLEKNYDENSLKCYNIVKTIKEKVYMSLVMQTLIIVMSDIFLSLAIQYKFADYSNPATIDIISFIFSIIFGSISFGIIVYWTYNFVIRKLGHSIKGK